MATAVNRAALQTALLSVRGLRRRRLGHIGPEHYPKNDLDKWGRKTNGGGRNGNGGMPSNLLGLSGGGRRPTPRASLVLGGERSISRRRQNGPNRANGCGEGANGKSLGVAMMEQQRSSMANRRLNGANGSSPPANGLDVQLRNVNGATSPTIQEEKKSSHGRYSSDLVVVLDMDECLIHSQFLSDQLVDKYRQVEDRPQVEERPNGASFRRGNNEEALLWSTCESFRIKLPDGDLVNVNKRPNLDLFLREITSKFETYVFTAAMEVYASPVLNKIDPDGDMFAGRFYREHCLYHPEMGVYAKDLCDVLRMRKMTIGDPSAEDGEGTSSSSGVNGFSCDERRVVLVDNNPLSFLPNPSNGILVSSFYDDPKDDTLEAVMELLHELDESEDVRPILDDRFGLKEALDDVVKGASVGW